MGTMWTESMRGREIPAPADMWGNVGRGCTVRGEEGRWAIVRTLPETIGEPRYTVYRAEDGAERSANLGQLTNLY